VTPTRRSRRWLLATLAALLLLPVGGWIAARALVVMGECRPGDAIVMLAGAGAYRERAAHAATLFHRGYGPDVLLTDDGLKGAWSTTHGRNLQLAEWAREELLERGVPADAITILQPTVSGTIDEARIIGDRTAADRTRSLVLVTSAHHSLRTLRTFRRQVGDRATLSICPAPLPPSLRRDLFWWITPDGWRRVGLEYVKLAYYEVRYR
jgi:uncharacterized SAM-binding protein YcdF (DUF218 family)